MPKNRWVLLRALRGRSAPSRRLSVETIAASTPVAVLVDAGLIERDDSGAISVPWSRIIAEMALDVAASA